MYWEVVAARVDDTEVIVIVEVRADQSDEKPEAVLQARFPSTASTEDVKTACNALTSDVAAAKTLAASTKDAAVSAKLLASQCIGLSGSV